MYPDSCRSGSATITTQSLQNVVGTRRQQPQQNNANIPSLNGGLAPSSSSDTNTERGVHSSSSTPSPVSSAAVAAASAAAVSGSASQIMNKAPSWSQQQQTSHPSSSDNLHYPSWDSQKHSSHDLGEPSTNLSFKLIVHKLTKRLFHNFRFTPSWSVYQIHIIILCHPPLHLRPPPSSTLTNHPTIRPSHLARTLVLIVTTTLITLTYLHRFITVTSRNRAPRTTRASVTTTIPPHLPLHTI